MRPFLAIALVLALCGCARREHELTEKRARATAETLIAEEDPGVEDLHHMEWHELKRVSAAEAVGTATLVYRYEIPGGGSGEERVPGRFVYRKNASGKWVLATIDFPNPKNLRHHLTRELSAEVTDVRVGTRRKPDADPEASGESQAADAARDREPSGAAEAGALSIDAARGAAERYLDAVPPVLGPSRAGGDTVATTWTVGSFSDLVAGDDGEMELPAILRVDGAEGRRTYRGVFRFARGPAGWALIGVRFQAPGAAPIDRAVEPPMAVR